QRVFQRESCRSAKRPTGGMSGRARRHEVDGAGLSADHHRRERGGLWAPGEREDHGACLGFWGGGDEPWPDAVVVPREYPAVQLVLAGPALNLRPLRGSNVEVRGRWEAE